LKIVLGCILLLIILIWLNFWGFNPILKVRDKHLLVSDDTIERLNDLKSRRKFVDLPGVGNSDELARLNIAFNGLLEQIIAGIKEHPQKKWVLKQFQPALKTVQGEDTEAQEHFGAELKKVMSILGIESSDGLIDYYRYGYILTYWYK